MHVANERHQSEKAEHYYNSKYHDLKTHEFELCSPHIGIGSINTLWF